MPAGKANHIPGGREEGGGLGTPLPWQLLSLGKAVKSSGGFSVFVGKVYNVVRFLYAFVVEGVCRWG